MALIIFDYDGVLADTLADLLRFGQQACDQLGVKHTVTQADLSNLEVMSFATYGRACEVPEHLVDEFVKISLNLSVFFIYWLVFAQPHYLFNHERNLVLLYKGELVKCKQLLLKEVYS